MTNEAELTQQPAASDKAEFARVEVAQAIETFRTQFSWLIQIITLLVLADVTVVGYAISEQIASVLLIGAVFPIMIIYARNRVNRLMVPVIYSAISIEHEYGGTKSDWLMATFLALTNSPDYVEALVTLSAEKDKNQWIQKYREVRQPILGIGKGLTHTALILITFGQLILPVILALFFNWRLF